MEDARAFFAEHFRPRRPDDGVSVLGGGGDESSLEDGRRFLALLADDGWAVPGWPVEYGGRGADAETAAAVSAELARYDTPDLYPYLVGLALVGPVLMAHGSEEQRTRFLPPIRAGEEIWCQLFSEPDAGSDLAGLATRAERDGDGWRVTGQKAWTSRGAYAQRGLLLARTDPAVPKHAGVTAFALPMDQPGVEVRPLRQINGDDHFSEVFLDGAWVDDADRIDGVGHGWGVALTTLTFERAGGGAGAGRGGGIHREQVVAHLREHGARSDPLVRQRAVSVIAGMQTASWTAERARRAATPGPEASGGKIRMAATLRDLAALTTDVQGLAGVTGQADDDWLTVFLTAPSISIRGGTDEIQRNVIGERVLGLPPEPRVDKTVPWTESRGRTGEP